MSNVNSLALISDNYLSDEDNEENGDELNSLEGEPKKENVIKLPLPDAVKKLYSPCVPEEIVDSPDLHDGRIRSFPHERGNWATCLFIPYKHSELLNVFCDSLIKICEEVADCRVCSDFHISLSRTVVVRHHWIQPLVDDLKKRTATLKTFPIDFDKLHIYSNDENTRTFVGLQVKLGYNHLAECVDCVNQSLTEFRLPTYYEDPSFHISLIWCTGDKKDDLTLLLPSMQSMYDSFKSNDQQLQYDVITKLCCKTGNRLYNFNFKS